MLHLDYSIIKNDLLYWLSTKSIISESIINFTTREIGLKFKYIVLAKENVYLYKVYLLTIISSF